MTRLFPKQAYIRILLILSAVFSVVVILCSVFLSYRFSEYAIAEIGKVNAEKTNHIADNMEFILNKLKAYSINIYEDQDINIWLNSDSDDPIQYVSASMKLSKMLSIEPFIDNVYLVSMKKQQIYETRSGLHSFDMFHDKAILDILANNNMTYLRCFTYDSEGSANLAMIVPSTPLKQNYYGYVVILLKKDLLQRYLLQNDVNTGVDIVTLDENGKVILGNLGSQSDGVMAKIRPTSGKTGSYEIYFNREKWMVHYDQIETQKWTVFHISDLKDISRANRNFRNTIILSFSGLLAILLAVLFWYSRRTLKPLGPLAEKIQKVLGQELSPNSVKTGTLKEFSVIDQGIEALKGMVDNLNSSMREHRGLIKSDYLQQWILHGKMNSSIQEYIGRETRLLTFRYLYLIIFRIESYHRFRSAYDFTSRKLLKFGIGNIAEELLENQGWAAEPVDLGTDCIVVLVSKNQDETELLKEVLNEVGVQTEKFIQSKLAIATSCSQSIEDDLRRTYENVYELTMLKFIWGEEKVYEEKDYEKFMQMAPVLPDEELLDELIQCVRLGKLDKAFYDLDLLMEQMQTMTYSNCKFHLTLCIYTILKAFNKYAQLHDFDGIQNQLDKFNTLIEVSEWLKKEISEISENFTGGKNSGRKEETVLEIVEYVENNLHNTMLTIEDISDHVSLSTRYVRQIFKEVFNTTLSDYILEKRIERAKNLLETTEWQVADIAERSGFQTRSHFFTVFKKATGITPNQYRQELKTN